MWQVYDFVSYTPWNDDPWRCEVSGREETQVMPQHEVVAKTVLKSGPMVDHLLQALVCCGGCDDPGTRDRNAIHCLTYIYIQLKKKKKIRVLKVHV